MFEQALILGSDHHSSKGCSPPEEAEGLNVEPASSKDTLTRVQSPRTSKSSGTVVQHLHEAGRASRDRHSEECTSSVSDQAAADLLQHAVSDSKSDPTQNSAELDSGQLTCDKSGKSPEGQERSRSSQSVQNRERLVEDAQSRPNSSRVTEQDPEQGAEDDVVPTTPKAAAVHPLSPAEEARSQKSRHQVSKQKAASNQQEEHYDCDLLARESSNVTLLDTRLVDTGAERDTLQDSQCLAAVLATENDSLSRVCSTAAAQSLTGFVRETDAAPASEFPAIQRRQRSNLGKRSRNGFKTPGNVSNAADGRPARTPSRQTNGLKKSQTAWGPDARGGADDDYVPPGGNADPDFPELRSQRSCRTRVRYSDPQEQDDASLLTPHRSTGLGSRSQGDAPAFGTITSTPSRSTRSQPQDLSCLWPCHFPSITPAKRLRGFNLTSAVSKLEELSSRDAERMSNASEAASSEAAELSARVLQSLEGARDLRDSFADYLTKAEPPAKHDREQTAKKFKGSPLGKILQATNSSQEMRSSEPKAEESISLPVDALSDASHASHLREWQKIVQQSDCPSQSSLRKRQRLDVEQCWEDFYESQALEQSVLSDLQEWLQPQARDEGEAEALV